MSLPANPLHIRRNLAKVCRFERIILKCPTHTEIALNQAVDVLAIQPEVDQGWGPKIALTPTVDVLAVQLEVGQGCRSQALIQHDKTN